MNYRAGSRYRQCAFRYFLQKIKLKKNYKKNQREDRNKIRSHRKYPCHAIQRITDFKTKYNWQTTSTMVRLLRVTIPKCIPQCSGNRVHIKPSKVVCFKCNDKKEKKMSQEK